MSENKILLVYQNDDGGYQIESVWATKEGNYYRINNIPFFTCNIALGDLISVEREADGGLYFYSLVAPSGHSTIQLVAFDSNDISDIGKELEMLGCTWEGSHLPNLISIDVPKEVPYGEIKKYLDKGEHEAKWSYKEACLSSEHSI